MDAVPAQALWARINLLWESGPINLCFERSGHQLLNMHAAAKFEDDLRMLSQRTAVAYAGPRVSSLTILAPLSISNTHGSSMIYRGLLCALDAR